MGGSAPPPDLPGIAAEGELLNALQREVATLLGRDSLKFPGAQPVSFSARHLLELQKDDYYVCEKSDGIRCLMYLTNDGPQEVVYLIDRKNDYRWVQNLHFPLTDSQQLFHIQTIVDGELVNDTQPNGQVQLKYLVFDCLVLDGNSLMHRTLDKRLAYFRDKVYNPYAALYKKYPAEIQFLPFIVEFKAMELGYGIEMMFKDILPNLPHGNDGLIFTCRNSPYKFGTDPHILKWKTESENSIDFLMTFTWRTIDPDSDDERDGITSPYPDYAAMPTFNLQVLHDGQRYEPYAVMHAEPHEWEAMKARQEPLDDRIVECYQDRASRWRFMRFRDDKTDANHISTVLSVIESIEDKISEKDLIATAKRIRDSWKSREAATVAAAQRERKSVSGGGGGGAVVNGVVGARDQQQAGGVKRKLADGGGQDGKRMTPQPGP